MATKTSANRWLGTPCTGADATAIRKRLGFIESAIGSRQNLEVLEIGAGLGLYIAPLLTSCSLYMATDINRSNVERI